MIAFRDSLFDAQLLRTLGHSVYGGAALGECLATAATIAEGDREGWYRAWTGLAKRSFAAAEVSGTLALLLAQQHHLSAPEAQSILTRTSRSVATPNGTVKSIDACAALAVVLHHGTCDGTEDVQQASQRSSEVR